MNRISKQSISKQKLLSGAAVAVVLAGAAVAAVTATGQGRQHAGRGHFPAGVRRLALRGQTRDLVTVASYLGLSTTQVRSDLQSGRTLAQIANATSGKSAAGLIEALVAAKKARLAKAAAGLPRRVTAEVNRPGGPYARARGARGRGWSSAGRALLATRGALGASASGYLGVPAAKLRADLQAGKTLAQIADATGGKSAAGLINALVAAKRGQLAAAAAAGLTTRAREDLLLAKLPKRMAALVAGASVSLGRP
jgi:hypothetical protein